MNPDHIQPPACVKCTRLSPFFTGGGGGGGGPGSGPGGRAWDKRGDRSICFRLGE